MSSCSHHTACIAQAVRHAEQVCHQAGARLTETRRRILEMLWASHQPRKAYDLLSDMDASAKPPTVYRALDFLQAMGLVHKVESLNAYIGCDGSHAHQYLICKKCGTVADIRDGALTRSLNDKAQQHGFQVESAIIELTGLCERCHA